MDFFTLAWFYKRKHTTKAITKLALKNISMKKTIILLLISWIYLTKIDAQINNLIQFTDSIVDHIDNKACCALESGGPIWKKTFFDKKVIGQFTSCVDASDKIYRERIYESYIKKNYDRIYIFYEYENKPIFYKEGKIKSDSITDLLELYFSNDSIILSKKDNIVVDTLITNKKIEMITNRKF